MKKNLLTSFMVLTIALSLSANCLAQEATTPGGRVGPTIENAGGSSSNTNGNGNISIGGITTYNPDTGMFGFDPTSWTDTNVGTTTPRTDPLTNEWSNTVGDTLSKGGQGVQYKTNRETFNSLKGAYKDTQR